ncbi:uncharacterized protein LOC107362881 [Tetranychus urticae]|uniref:Uncharacterized protein n=1 Tax=Tetranychus urticae TaxID=32264 RepID=T1KD21_TETUR|nr:uncharacterized protein LOC107362881 [Tetranychus urticae]XP_025016782.1 uncharacterized protein LOC107362881 [Tetranychus urticae]
MDEQIQLPYTGKTFEYFGKFVSLLVFPPFKYVQTLVVLGVEPLPLYVTKTPLGQPMLAFPSIISIARHISKECGFFHLYTGFPLIVINRIIQSRVRKFLAPYKFLGDQKEPPIFGTYFMENINLPREDEGSEADELEDVDEELEEDDYEEIDDFEVEFLVLGSDDSSINSDDVLADLDISPNDSNPLTEFANFLFNLSKSILQTTCIRVISLTLSYPFEVLYIRRCAQFVGNEIIYSSILSGARDIYKHEGIKGFYSGFIPRALAEIIGIAATQTLFSALFKPCVTRANIRFFFNNTTRNLARYLLYPLKLVSVIMAVKPCDRLAASKLDPHFSQWISCWRYLNSTGQLRRGYQVIWRYQRHLSVDDYFIKNSHSSL